MSLSAAITFLVQRIGPYHHARLQALASSRSGKVSVIEFRAGEGVYGWSRHAEAGEYARLQSGSRVELLRALDGLKPRVLVCVGYSDPEISQAMAWALERKVALVTCSDSTWQDEPRSRIKEALKRRYVSAFGSALVAGSRAGEYLAGLGIPAERQFRPWDVVDNGHFAGGADRARSRAESERERLKLPPRYFLCVARFVAKKNLAGLIDAYARYVAEAGAEAWALVLSGSGPLEAELRSRVAAAGLDRHVHFPGFLQYPDMPACYGLTGALVLPSVSDQWGLVVNEAMAAGLPVLVSDRCGCAPELVREGENGCTFSPGDPAGLARHMTTLARSDPARLAEMGRCSRAGIAGYSPEAFAMGLGSAIGCALSQAPRPGSRLGRVLIRILALRSAPKT